VERRTAMRALRANVAAEDVDWWVERFLADAGGIHRRARRKPRRK
jgi:trehalose-6-phosphate synthase